VNFNLSAVHISVAILVHKIRTGLYASNGTKVKSRQNLDARRFTLFYTICSLRMNYHVQVLTVLLIIEFSAVKAPVQNIKLYIDEEENFKNGHAQ